MTNVSIPFRKMKKTALLFSEGTVSMLIVKVNAHTSTVYSPWHGFLE